LVALFVLQELRTEEPLLPLRLFKERTVAVGNAVLFIVGFGMFGAIAFLPMYLQVVKGASATLSGLEMAPFMLGIVTAAVFAGRYSSATGRYRIFPIIGTALMVVGLALMSQLGSGTGMLEAGAYMVVLGAGIGMVMPMIVLAVQNTVEYKDMGTATASTNFFRSMGASFGVALAGAIVSNRLDYWLPRLVDKQALGDLDPQVLTASPERLHQLPAPVMHGVADAFANSVDTAFLWAAPVVVLAFLVSFLLRESPLRETAHVGAAATEEAGEESRPTHALDAEPIV
jgi:MFS family permease